ncbi:MAG: AbrB/MazE/SpoVT family DNA-binding domain-containing protein [Bryobacteraceae bacterium]
MRITLANGSIKVRITSKGQVTIPQEIRNRLGLLPHTKVEFELAGDHARIRKARRLPGESVRGRLALEVLRGTADTRMSTEEILALTRGETRATARRK